MYRISERKDGYWRKVKLAGRVLLLLILTFVLGGCMYLRVAPELPPPQVQVVEVVSKEISAAAGGVITVTEEMSPVLAGLVLDVPPGALMADTVITVGEIGYGLPPLPDGYIPISPIIALVGTAGLTFQHPATIRIPVPEDMHMWAGIAAPEDILLKRYDREMMRWLRTPVKYIEENMLVAKIPALAWGQSDQRYHPIRPAGRGSYLREGARMVGLRLVARVERILPWHNPASDREIRIWAQPLRIDYLDRLNVRREGVRFSDKIGHLLLAEAMWEKLADGNLYAGTNMVRLAVKTISAEVAVSAALKAMGLTAIAPAAAAASIVYTGLRAFLRHEEVQVINSQLRAYLSWRGWFFEGGRWRHIQRFANSHETVMRSPFIQDDPTITLGGWFVRMQRSDGSISDRPAATHFRPALAAEDRIRKAREPFFKLGDALADLLDRVHDQYGRPTGLQRDRERLRRAFMGIGYPPIAMFTATPFSGIAPLTVSFNAAGSSDPDGDIVSYTWTFGDGRSGSGITVTHTFINPGDFTVRLTVTDSRGASNSTTQIIRVDPPAPTVRIIFPPDGAIFAQGAPIFFQGSATDPEDRRLTGVSLVWTSNIDGRIGTGESFTRSDLSVGTHDIVLTAFFVQGVSWGVGVTITVQAQQDQDYEVTFPDPYLEKAIREQLNGHTGPILRSDLLGLTRLGVRWWWQKKISDLTGMEYLTNLIQLYFSGNQISDITPLAGLTNLRILDLCRNQISDITPLAGLINLTDLWLAHNQIRDISPLAGLTNLFSLDLGDNQIRDITPLAGLTNLTWLELMNNQISDITPLARLTNLTALRLGQNQISDITPLAGLTNLFSLQLWWNQISDITPLAGLTNLVKLWLCGNQISDITPLAGLTNLTGLGPSSGLGLRYNQISDLAPLVANTGLGARDRVYLQGNPLDLTPGSQNMHDIEELRRRGVIVILFL